MNLTNLTSQHCVPCKSGTPPMPLTSAERTLKDIPGWQMEEVDSFRETIPGRAYNKLTREFIFANFKESMDFVNKVAKIAEAQGHHPDIYIFYSLVKLSLWTHAAEGLTENDFIMAAKINNLR